MIKGGLTGREGEGLTRFEENIPVVIALCCTGDDEEEEEEEDDNDHCDDETLKLALHY